jgi:hypothetical protein
LSERNNREERKKIQRRKNEETERRGATTHWSDKNSLLDIVKTMTTKVSKRLAIDVLASKKSRVTTAALK